MNIINPDDCSFDNNECRWHQVPGKERISVAWDEHVLNKRNTVVISRIEKVDDEKSTIINPPPERYHDYISLFRPAMAEKLGPCHIFN